MEQAEAQPGRLRLLLVDDEQEYLRVLKKRMGRRGMEVCAVPSGTEAIGILRGTDFDVAVVDLKMEDMDGLEVLKVFKKMVPRMPVIILTGHGSEKAAREGIAMGAYDYLTKPCDLSDLLEKIREAAEAARDLG